MRLINLFLFFILLTKIVAFASNGFVSRLSIFFSEHCLEINSSSTILACYAGKLNPDPENEARKPSRRFQLDSLGCTKGYHGIKATNLGENGIVKVETSFGSWNGIVRRSIGNMSELRLEDNYTTNKDQQQSVCFGSDFSQESELAFDLYLDDHPSMPLLIFDLEMEMDKYGGLPNQGQGKDLCKVHPTEAGKTPRVVPKEICYKNPEWKRAKPAYLNDDFGKELVVRIGFVSVKNNHSARADWFTFNNDYMNAFVANLSRSLDFDEYFYASIQNFGLELGEQVSQHDDVEVLVHNCTFGVVTSAVQAVQAVKESDGEQKAWLDWSQDFVNVNDCMETPELVADIITQMVNDTVMWDEVKVEMMKSKTHFGVTRPKEFKKAHQYKYGYSELKRMPLKEKQESRIKSLGRIISREEDFYKPTEFNNFTAHFKNITEYMVKKYNYEPTGDNYLIWKGCAEPDYCAKYKQKIVDECEKQKADYVTCECCEDKDNCNQDWSRKCWTTKGDRNVHLGFVPSAKNATIAANFVAKDQPCEKNENITSCVTEYCIPKGNEADQWIRKICGSKDYCEIQRNAGRVKEHCESKLKGEYTCETCEKNNCNDNFTNDANFAGRRCWDTSGFVSRIATDAKAGKKDRKCQSEENSCLTEVCKKGDGKGFMIKKKCATTQYCKSDEAAEMEKYCKEEFSATYERNLCETCDKDNCNGPQSHRKCLNTGGGFADANTTHAPVGDEHGNCKVPGASCLTKICKRRPPHYLAFGLFAVNYTCPHAGISFLFPRFNGAILNETEHRVLDGQVTEYNISWDGKTTQNITMKNLKKDQCQYDSESKDRKCWDTEGTFINDTAKGPFDKKEHEQTCQHKESSSCLTEYYRQKPNQYIAFGIMALQYKCPKNTQFLMPRFDGVFLKGKKGVSDPKEMEPEERNFATDYTVNGGKKTEVDPDNLKKCRYTVTSGEAMEDC